MHTQAKPYHYDEGRRPERSKAARLVAAAAVFACLYFAGTVIMTVTVAVLLVFLCDPAVTWLHVHRVPRAVGAFLMVLVLLGGAYGLSYLFSAQASNLMDDMPNYADKIGTHVARIRKKAQEFEKQAKTAIGEQQPKAANGEQQQQQPQSAPVPPAPSRKGRTRTPQPVAVPAQAEQQREDAWSWSWLGAGLVSFTEVIFLVSFIPFLVFFLLSWKDHIRRNALSIFTAGNRMTAERAIDSITLMIRRFILGNLLIGVILSVASGVFFWLMKLPYPAILGPVSGFLSLIPYLGVALGALPAALAALGQYSTLSPVFATIAGVVGLHLVALNVLYPKLIGSRLHLNPVVVTVSLMFWGWLWGAMGLLLAIPITGGIKAVCDNVPSLRQYGRLMAD